MSATSILKKVREALDVPANDDILPAVQVLQQPKPQPVSLVVTWTPGTPELQASLNVLSNEKVPVQMLSATLRAGLAVLEYQLALRAAQMQARLQEAMEEKRANEVE